MMAARTGNLTIWISDDEDEPERRTTEGEDKKAKDPEPHEFKGLNATIVAHFCMQDLKRLSMTYHCSVERKDSIGQTDSLLIKQKPDADTYGVKRCLDSIEKKLNSIQKQELVYTKSDLPKIKEFVVEKGDVRSTALYIGEDDSTVTVVGETFTDVEKTFHELKIHLGLVRQSNRAQRHLSPDTSSDELTEKSKLQPLQAYSKSPTHSPYGNSANNETFSFEVKLPGNFILKVYKASITHLTDVDVIVNAANDNLMHGGGVARVISRAAGRKLDIESQEYVNTKGLLAVTKNCLTTAGNLRYRSVVHAVGPQWHDYKDKVHCMDDVYDTVFNVLRRCDENSYKSVGIPAISAGIYGVPKVLCADMYVKAAVDYSQTGKRCPREMHFIDVDMEILKLVKQTVEKWQRNPREIDQRVTVPAYLKANPSHGSYTSYKSSQGGNYTQGQGQSNRRNRTFQKQASREEDSTEVDEVPYAVGIEQFDKEKFRWGGVADVFLVGSAITVKIFKGEIDKVKNLDALVCGIDRHLNSTGFVARALKTAGGSRYEQGLDGIRSRNNHSGLIHEVFTSDPGNLGVKHVIHLVSDRVELASKEEVEAYKRGMEKVLVKAKKWKLTSLAIPLIGTGNIQDDNIKLQKCCSALLRAICDFCSKEDEPSVTEIHLVNNSTKVCDALVNVFKSASDSSSKSKGRKYAASSTGSGNGATGFSTASKDKSPVRNGRDQPSSHSKDYSSSYRHGDSSSHRDGNNSSHRHGDSSGLSERSESGVNESGSLWSERRTYTADGKIEEKGDDGNDRERMEVDEECIGDNERDENRPKLAETPRKGNLMIIEDD